MTRRLFTVLLAALGFSHGPSRPCAAGEADAAPRLVRQPDHAPIIIAKERGLFAKRGLDVQLVEPSDPSAPPRLVAADRATSPSATSRATREPFTRAFR